MKHSDCVGCHGHQSICGIKTCSVKHDARWVWSHAGMRPRTLHTYRRPAVECS